MFRMNTNPVAPRRRIIESDSDSSDSENDLPQRIGVKRRNTRVVNSESETSQSDEESDLDDFIVSDDDDTTSTTFYNRVNNQKGDDFLIFPRNDEEDCFLWLKKNCPIDFERGFFKNFIIPHGLGYLQTFGANQFKLDKAIFCRKKPNLILSKCCLCSHSRRLSYEINDGRGTTGFIGPDCALRMRLAILYYQIISFIKSMKDNFDKRKMVKHVLSIFKQLQEERIKVENIITERYLVQNPKVVSDSCIIRFSNLPKDWEIPFSY